MAGRERDVVRGGVPPGDDGAEALVAEARRRVGDLPDVPLPGGGLTSSRWQLLADVAYDDLSLVRVVEGHLDAVAILAELGGRDAGEGELLGVWAARPEELSAERRGHGWVLRGRKPFCSGSTLLDSALVTATTEEGPQLFVVDAPSARRCVGTWQPLGMAGTRSETLEFDGILVRADAAVGAPGGYVSRPGFAQGGCGVAACWWGGAVALLDDLELRLAERPDDLADAAWAAAAVQVDGAGLILRSAAALIDRQPDDATIASLAAARSRCGAATAGRAVLAAAAAHLGTSVLGTDARVGRRMADLTTYLTQHRESALLDLHRRLRGHSWRLEG